jgi:hypothetical protein
VETAVQKYIRVGASRIEEYSMNASMKLVKFLF